MEFQGAHGSPWSPWSPWSHSKRYVSSSKEPSAVTQEALCGHPESHMWSHEQCSLSIQRLICSHTGFFRDHPETHTWPSKGVFWRQTNFDLGPTRGCFVDFFVLFRVDSGGHLAYFQGCKLCWSNFGQDYLIKISFCYHWNRTHM